MKTSYPNQKTVEQVLQDILWRHSRIEELQKTINDLYEYAKDLPGYDEYEESIESYDVIKF